MSMKSGIHTGTWKETAIGYVEALSAGKGREGRGALNKPVVLVFEPLDESG